MEISSELTVQLVDQSVSDAKAVQAARVSTVGQNEGKDSLPLIRYLMRNRHGSPFEHGSMTFYVKAPIFVFREFHRHRIGWSYNEESGRYKELAPEFYIPARDRNLVQVGKPGAYEYRPGTDVQIDLVQESLGVCADGAYAAYEDMLKHGIAREVARMCLPVNIYTSMYATCNPRSLMAFLSLRTQRENSLFDSRPMAEIDRVATQLEILWKALMPITWQAFEDSGRVAP